MNNQTNQQPFGKTIVKRIQKEIEELSYVYPLYDYHDQSPYKKELIIDYNNDIYFFSISRNYPFQQPTLLINGVEIINLLHNYHRLLHKLNKIQPDQCICMSSLFCSNNWSPAFKIQDLIKDVEKHKNKIKHDYKIQYIKPILSKHNIHEKGIIHEIFSFYDISSQIKPPTIR